jgi:hypothetical protein
MPYRIPCTQTRPNADMKSVWAVIVLVPLITNVWNVGALCVSK